ncbi:hypothetical protein C8R31_102353 [Nitrosospira sp. Nsp2]|nr:hypothetical protein C8R31_102353 [Nitrosospira sp. Nsp2]
MECNHRCDIIVVIGTLALILWLCQALAHSLAGSLALGSLDKIVTRNLGLNHPVLIFKLTAQVAGTASSRRPAWRGHHESSCLQRSVVRP